MRYSMAFAYCNIIRLSLSLPTECTLNKKKLALRTYAVASRSILQLARGTRDHIGDICCCFYTKRAVPSGCNFQLVVSKIICLKRYPSFLLDAKSTANRPTTIAFFQFAL